VKNSYLNTAVELQLMSGVSLVSGKESGDMNISNASELISGLRKLMKHKYSDLFLLCSVAVAFGTLLVVSALG
jgi:hypothetical protein